MSSFRQVDNVGIRATIPTHSVVAKSSGKVQKSLPPLHRHRRHRPRCLLTSPILEQEVM